MYDDDNVFFETLIFCNSDISEPCNKSKHLRDVFVRLPVQRSDSSRGGYCPYLVSWLYIPPVCVEGPLPGGRPGHPPAGDHLDGRRGRGGAARGLRPRRVLRLPQGAGETQRYTTYVI